MRRSTRWNLVRLYVLTFAVPVLVVVTLFGWYVASDVSRPVEQVVATATESSRPLDGGDRAPADWTGDGVADGWLGGEWLPGQSGTVYLVAGEQVGTPTGPIGYTILGLLATIIVAALFSIVGYVLFDRFDRIAWHAARRDWDATVSQASRWRDGVPLWG